MHIDPLPNFSLGEHRFLHFQDAPEGQHQPEAKHEEDVTQAAIKKAQEEQKRTKELQEKLTNAEFAVVMQELRKVDADARLHGTEPILKPIIDRLTQNSILLEKFMCESLLRRSIIQDRIIDGLGLHACGALLKCITDTEEFVGANRPPLSEEDTASVQSSAVSRLEALNRNIESVAISMIARQFSRPGLSSDTYQVLARILSASREGISLLSGWARQSGDDRQNIALVAVENRWRAGTIGLNMENPKRYTQRIRYMGENTMAALRDQNPVTQANALSLLGTMGRDTETIRTMSASAVQKLALDMSAAPHLRAAALRAYITMQPMPEALAFSLERLHSSALPIPDTVAILEGMKIHSNELLQQTNTTQLDQWLATVRQLQSTGRAQILTQASTYLAEFAVRCFSPPRRGDRLDARMIGNACLSTTLPGRSNEAVNTVLWAGRDTLFRQVLQAPAPDAARIASNLFGQWRRFGEAFPIEVTSIELQEYLQATRGLFPVLRQRLNDVRRTLLVGYGTSPSASDERMLRKSLVEDLSVAAESFGRVRERITSTLSQDPTIAPTDLQRMQKILAEMALPFQNLPAE